MLESLQVKLIIKAREKLQNHLGPTAMTDASSFRRPVLWKTNVLMLSAPPFNATSLVHLPSSGSTCVPPSCEDMTIYRPNPVVSFCLNVTQLRLDRQPTTSQKLITPTLGPVWGRLGADAQLQAASGRYRWSGPSEGFLRLSISEFLSLGFRLGQSRLTPSLQQLPMREWWEICALF